MQRSTNPEILASTSITLNNPPKSIVHSNERNILTSYLKTFKQDDEHNVLDYAVINLPTIISNLRSHVVILPGVDLAAIASLPAHVTTVELPHDATDDMKRSVPKTVKRTLYYVATLPLPRIDLVARIAPEANVTEISLNASTSVEEARNILKHIIVVRIWDAKPEVVANLPQHIRSVIINSSTSKEVVQNISPHLLSVAIEDAKAEVVAKLPIHIKNVRITQLTSSEKVESIPLHITSVVIIDAKADVVAKLPQHIKCVIIDSFTSDKAVESIPLHITKVELWDAKGVAMLPKHITSVLINGLFPTMDPKAVLKNLPETVLDVKYFGRSQEIDRAVRQRNVALAPRQQNAITQPANTVIANRVTATFVPQPPALMKSSTRPAQESEQIMRDFQTQIQKLQQTTQTQQIQIQNQQSKIQLLLQNFEMLQREFSTFKHQQATSETTAVSALSMMGTFGSASTAKNDPSTQNQPPQKKHKKS